MGNEYGIIIPENPDFSINLARFAEKLSEIWPDASVWHNEVTGNFDFNTVKEVPIKSLGTATQSGEIVWWGDLETFAEFCLWYRGFVPRTTKLLAHLDTEFVVITPSSSIQDILDGLSATRYMCKIAGDLRTTDYTMDISRFAAKLLERWQDAIVPKPTAESQTWWLKTQWGSIEGNQVAINLSDTNPATIAEFVIWYRAYIPAEYELVLYCEHTAKHGFVLLTPEITERVIADALQIVT